MQRYSKEKQIINQKNKNVAKLLITSFSGAIIFILLLISASAIILKNDMSGSSVTAISFICCILSGFITGFITGRRIKVSGFIYGLLSSSLICIALIALTVIIADSLGKNIIFACLSTLIASAIGGILAVNMKRKIRY